MKGFVQSAGNLSWDFRLCSNKSRFRRKDPAGHWRGDSETIETGALLWVPGSLRRGEAIVSFHLCWLCSMHPWRAIYHELI